MQKITNFEEIRNIIQNYPFCIQKINFDAHHVYGRCEGQLVRFESPDHYYSSEFETDGYYIPIYDFIYQGNIFSIKNIGIFTIRRLSTNRVDLSIDSLYIKSIEVDVNLASIAPEYLREVLNMRNDYGNVVIDAIMKKLYL